jgi:hypothetical protein
MNKFVGNIFHLNSSIYNSNDSDAMIREAIENLIIHDCHSFGIVESKHFLTLLKLCLNCTNKEVFIPKSDAVKDGIVKRVLYFKEQLSEKLKNVTASKFHLAFDAWTSSGFNFLAISCHYIDDDWILRKNC